MKQVDPQSWLGATGWPRGYLRPCLLLLVAEESAHGYDLLDRLEALGTPAIDAGTLYRTLRAMEREQLLESRWEVSPTGPARRTYQITAAGERELRGWVEVLTEGQRSMAAYLRRCAAVKERTPLDRSRRLVGGR